MKLMSNSVYMLKYRKRFMSSGFPSRTAKYIGDCEVKTTKYAQIVLDGSFVVLAVCEIMLIIAYPTRWIMKNHVKDKKSSHGDHFRRP